MSQFQLKFALTFRSLQAKYIQHCNTSLCFETSETPEHTENQHLQILQNQKFVFAFSPHTDTL